tara:strand:- start:328 stop:1887 length:1560 start_codon:yes stop_codon:yes gene_type:complete
MEYNSPSLIVKDMNFGKDGKNKIMSGVNKLSQAVASTLGASGKCVIYEDDRGRPIITKDGVTVAESVVLYDPVENLGAHLIKEAAKKTVSEAGDGTTTATVLAHSLLTNALKENKSTRDVKNGVESAINKVCKYLDSIAIPVKGKMLDSVAAISCNNDAELGRIIAEAYKKVGQDGIVLMEDSEDETTYADITDGIKLDCKLTSQHWITDKERNTCVLDNPYVLLVSSTITSIRKIQAILEHVIKQGRSLLIVADVDQQVKSALLMNKIKGNIKVNIIDTPGFGPTKMDTIEDLAILTGAKVMNEELGDDLDLIQPDCLGEVVKSVTDNRTTVLTTGVKPANLDERVNDVKKSIKKEKNAFVKDKLQDRLAMLTGSVGVIKVGANSKVALNEKKARVEDAIYATKAALQEGIVPGGGVALVNAVKLLNTSDVGENIVAKSIISPYKTIVSNSGIKKIDVIDEEGYGIDVITGEKVKMVDKGIIDPVLVTKTALKNAGSVAATIISAECVISNMRTNESN